MTVSQILLVFALALFTIAAIWRPNPAPRFDLTNAGLACWVLSILLSGAHL